MARPKWVPKTDEQRDAVAAATRAAKRLEAAEQALWDAIDAARKLRVPMTYLAEVVGRGRATLYRRSPKAQQKARTSDVQAEEGTSDE